MSRKPTRFWHPAKRLALQAHETLRTLGTKRDTTVQLADVRPRLQRYLRALYDEDVTIESLASPDKPSFAVRALQKLALARQINASESTAQCIRLPATLRTSDSGVSPLEQYRVMAVQHAERLRRSSAHHAGDVTTDLERDLYQLAEAAAVDSRIIESQPGLRNALAAARAESVAQRPTPRFRTAIELRVEELFRRALPAASSEANAPEIPRTNDAAANATWARRTAVDLEVKFGRRASQAYRRVPEITLWQTTIRAEPPENRQMAIETESRQRSIDSSNRNSKAANRSTLPGGAQSRSEGSTPGDTSQESNDAHASSHASHARNDIDHSSTDEARSADNHRVNSGKSAKRNRKSNPGPKEQDNRNNEQKSDRQPVEATSTGTAAGNASAKALAHSDHIVGDRRVAEGVTYCYPEWDCTVQKFNAVGTVVREVPTPLDSPEWAMTALQLHARESQLAKRQFERLRSHRLRLRKQVQGDELDLEACVEAMVDRRMHVAPADRLYSHVRPGRRDLAIMLLIDISASTGDAVDGQQRVIDVERIAALVACAAFDALGDTYSIVAFSSAGASNVRVHTLKAFGENNSSLVMQRIGALEPHGTTRLGSAVRHATAMLSQQAAPHRLMLILSDGKPNDYDWYFVDYAVQDSRQAVTNARSQGVHPFCITVDAAGGETYLPKIFGSDGYRVVNKPSQMPQALLQAVLGMIAN